jgi:peptidoglycan/xylan/chitin deacetylase (PgdA/CDA1 family)
MTVCLTFDYELFFGEKSGSVDMCLLQPTNRLLEMFEKHQVQATFFADASYLLKLKSDADKNDVSAKELSQISVQLHQMVQAGHEIGLHIHPHWMESDRAGQNWKLNIGKYRLSQWEKEERERHFMEACEWLREFEPKMISFRAGGWCIQPFSDFRNLFEKYRIKIDSSVVPGFRMNARYHQFDFSRAPDNLSVWAFSDNPNIPENDGLFYEVPVTPDAVYPFHQYKMFLLHRLKPLKHLPVGDGNWIKEKFHHYSKYFLPYHHYATTDGYFASRLKKNFMKKKQKGFKCFTTLGHPKSMSECSFEALEEFILFAKEYGAEFKTIREFATGRQNLMNS